MKQKKNEPSNITPDPTILFQDESLLVLNKPPYWVVNDAATAHGNKTIQSFLKLNMKSLGFVFESEDSKSDFVSRVGIVHRLDKETSGVMLVAKTQDSFNKLQKQFLDRTTKKVYVALVHGDVPSNEGEIKLTVGRLPWNKRRFGVVADGRDSHTNFKVKKRFSSEMGKFTLLELVPKTGRTHQIRIHMKHLGHPLVADPVYAGRKIYKKDIKWCSRLFLHAQSLTFTHPLSGDIITVEAPMPDDLKHPLQHL